MWSKGKYKFQNLLDLQDGFGLPKAYCDAAFDGSYLITQLFPHGEVELETKERVQFKVNGERIKIYFGFTESTNEVIEGYHVD